MAIPSKTSRPAGKGIGAALANAKGGKIDPKILQLIMQMLAQRGGAPSGMPGGGMPAGAPMPGGPEGPMPPMPMGR